MNTLLSVFDYSGTWAEPFARNGWEVIQWDIKISELMDINLLTDAGQVLDMFEDVHGIIAAVPCTDIAGCGAQYWSQKDADGRTEKSKELVRQVFRLANLFKPTDPDYYEESGEPFFWAMENPVGRMNTLFPDLERPVYFQPWEFAGYIDHSEKDLKRLDKIRCKGGKNVTARETDFVLKTNAYTKKTGLWGEFNTQLIKKTIEPVRTCAQGSPMQRQGGGNKEKGQEIRSNTPEGFAQAFYDANHNYQAPLY